MIYLPIFPQNLLLKSIICVIFAQFSLLKHDACMVESVNDIYVGQIGVKGQADFPIITDNNCLF